jgi:hypothetical protein
MTRTHTYTIRDNDETIMRRYSQTITFIRRRYYKTIIHVTGYILQTFGPMLCGIARDQTLQANLKQNSTIF